MRIGAITISEPPDDDGEFLDWRDGELCAAGDALLLDDRTAGMCFDGRPITNMEMEAASIAAHESWPVLAEKWIQSFEIFLREKA